MGVGLAPRATPRLPTSALPPPTLTPTHTLTAIHPPTHPPHADYLNKVVVKGKNSSSTKVADIMTPTEKLITVTPNHRRAWV